MWCGPSLLLLLCCTLYGTDAQHEPNTSEAPRRDRTPTVTEAAAAAAGAPRVTASSPSSSSFSPSFSTAKVPTDSGQTQEPSTAEALEDELSNQENVISQLLGDYDKVKTISSGSDCVCRCVVRPIKRSDCSDPAAMSRAAYTVDTITKGTDCKRCVCMAPPSAVNPCEGEYRFKKLQEASKDDIKLATIIDLLEGSLYGMDLLKLQSVTTKLLNRMDDLETAFVANLTERAREKERLKDKGKEKKVQQKKKKVSEMGTSGQKSRPPVNSNKQKNQEGQLKKNQQPEGVEQKQPTNNKTVGQKAVKEKNSVVVKGVTFYKAEEESFRETERGRAKNTSWSLLFSDQLPPVRTLPVQSPAHAPTVSAEPHSRSPSQRGSSLVPTERPTTDTTTAQQTPATTSKAATTTKQTTVAAPTTTPPTTAQPTTRLTRPSTSAPHTNLRPPAEASPTAKAGVAPRSRLSWTESPADQPKTTKKPGVCKDTVASLSDPVQFNSYGLSDGAWMKDVRGHGNVIYLTSGLYGNNLIEFRDLQTFKSGQPSNSYKLPYSYTGTGHVVFNGAFYYNRAFSRDIIRYDLRHRYVAAWTTLHDAILEEQVHRTQTEVELAVDESGLWLLYPALDTEGFHQEVILLVHLSSRDLQPIRTFRTGLRRGLYGNSFLVCGVLYGVNSMEHHYANVTYAFDTHTLTHTVPSLAFTNMHGHTSQLAYCPLDKKLYAWDNGHQMMYDVIFAY